MVSKRCRVCGDKAIGFNFAGLSCNSCKAFFRRATLKQDLICENSKICEINKFTRKNCMKCRFDKCLAIGMRKDLVSYHGKRTNRDKPKTVVQTIDRISLLSNEYTLNLKMVELTRLQDILNANLKFPDENSCQIIAQVESVPQMVNLGVHNIRHVIRFCKSMEPFNCLNKDDQVRMLKCFMPEKTLMRIAFLYNTQTNGWTAIAHPNCDKKAIFAKMDFMKNWFDKDAYKIFYNFVIKMHQELENDRTILDLILVLLLFKHRPNIHKAEFVRYHNFVFHYLLRRYLEHKYLNKNRATQKYYALMSLLGHMDTFNESVKQFCAKAPINIEFAPVIKEIFNLPVFAQVRQFVK